MSTPPGHLTRRTLLASSLAALAASRLRADTRVTTPSETTLNRLTFGATPASRAEITDLGPRNWLDTQLGMPATDPAFEARLAAQTLRIQYDTGEEPDVGTWAALDEMRPLSSLHADPADFLYGIDWEQALAWEERVRPANEVIAASLTRAVHAPAQLREMMTQFWHDHFNVHAHKNEYTATFFPAYDRALRENALGNIRDLLQAVATGPAMLVYLNNDESRASPANENFARELLELHTLGEAAYLNADHPRWSDVPLLINGTAAGYIDEDVYEVARAFTGWTVADGRWLNDGHYAPATGTFHYEDSWHDPYQKRILAREFPPNRAAMADGLDVLDMLAAHPATARHICTKIARRLLTDTPSEQLITALRDTYLGNLDNPDQIAEIIRTLVAHPDWDTPPSKLRRPFEFLAALYRATGAKVATPEAAFHWQLSRAGWQQHTYPPPTGHPDTAQEWLSGTLLLRMTDMALYAHDDWFGNTQTRLTSIPNGVTTFGDLARNWSTHLHGTPYDALPELLAHLDVSATEPLPTSPEDLHDLSTTAAALAALSPRFLFR